MASYTVATASASIAGAKTLWGWNFAENGGTPGAARVLLRDGSSSGAIIADIHLAITSSKDVAYKDAVDLREGDLYVEVASGTVRGAVYWD